MVARGNSTTNRGALQHSVDVSQIGIVAHELKSPLATIRQLSLEMQDDSLSAAERRLIAEQIEHISERALRLSSDLAASSKLESRQFPTTVIDAGSLCNRVLTDIRPIFRANNRKIGLKTSTHKHLISGNYNLLHRILINFTDNALHYTDEASVITLYTELRKKDSVYRVGVRDYGNRLPDNIWQLIKKRHQVDRITQVNLQSSGLGLSIAHRFADVMGGRIGAIRHRDGASFYIDMPLSEQVSLL